MGNWRLIVSKPHTGTMNMAIDEAVMLAVCRGESPPTIRFYRWSEPVITLGYFQRFNSEIDHVSCSKNGVRVIRRLTGGRAVLHHLDLSYSLVAPETNHVVKGTVEESYLKISRGLQYGLRKLGIAAEITGGHGKIPFSAACFDSPARCELTVCGRKLVGSAQVRREGCVLQHGSLVIKAETDLLFSCLRFTDNETRQKAKSSFESKATSLEEVLGKPPGFRELAIILAKGLSTVLGITMVPGTITNGELTEASCLCESRYGRTEWNHLRR